MRKISAYYSTNLVLPRKLYDTIEQKVVSLYFEHNIKESPIHPFEIAKNRGYVLCPYSELNDVFTTPKDVLELVEAFD